MNILQTNTQIHWGVMTSIPKLLTKINWFSNRMKLKNKEMLMKMLMRIMLARLFWSWGKMLTLLSIYLFWCWSPIWRNLIWRVLDFWRMHCFWMLVKKRLQLLSNKLLILLGSRLIGSMTICSIQSMMRWKNVLLRKKKSNLIKNEQKRLVCVYMYV